MGLPCDLDTARATSGDVGGAVIREISIVHKHTENPQAPEMVRIVAGRANLLPDEKEGSAPGEFFVLTMPCDIGMAIAWQLAGQGDAMVEKFSKLLEENEEKIRLLLALGLTMGYGFEVYRDLAKK
jgi:hypothetical protein